MRNFHAPYLQYSVVSTHSTTALFLLLNPFLLQPQRVNMAKVDESVISEAVQAFRGGQYTLIYVNMQAILASRKRPYVVTYSMSNHTPLPTKTSSYLSHTQEDWLV